MNREYLGSKLKYVINQRTGRFAIFDLTQNHSDYARVIDPTHAGFIQFYKYECDDKYANADQLGAECFGLSESLQLKSDKEIDSNIITHALKER